MSDRGLFTPATVTATASASALFLLADVGGALGPCGLLEAWPPGCSLEVASGAACPGSCDATVLNAWCGLVVWGWGEARCMAMDGGTTCPWACMRPAK